MWTPTDHWLEITIETLGRWEGWMAQGALQGENITGKYLCNLIVPSFFLPANIFFLYPFHDEAFKEGGGEGVVICKMRLLIRIGETCQINLNGAEL